VADESLLAFVDMIDADLATNIMLGYVGGYVEARERYDETQEVVGRGVETSSVVLVLKGLAGVVRKLSAAQVEMNLSRIAPLGLTVIAPRTRCLLFGDRGVDGRRCMMTIRRFVDRVWRCVYPSSLSSETRIESLMRCVGLRRIRVS
jgi:hypothetical protein